MEAEVRVTEDGSASRGAKTRIDANSKVEVQSQDKTHIFRDTLDLQLICKSDLAKVNEEELTAIEIVVYQYGIYVLDLLKTHFSVGELQLHIASSLPENNHRGNAFSQSFFYQKSEDKLYISREYLKSVGSLILLIVHCISHIACGDVSDDTSASFLRIFYEGLKICFSDGFLSRLQMLPSSQDTKSNSKTEGKTEKRTHFIGNDSKLKPHRGVSVFKEPLNKTGEMLCQHKTEMLLKNKLSARKREFFNQSLKEGTSNPGNGPSFDEGISPAHLEEIEDDLNFQLIKILEKEIEHGSSLNNEDEMCCYSHMISLEKECLRKKIKSFEKMTDKQNRPV
ncbi:uncharacterized protein LOC128470574 [Spea bombifrons]|uniref:uncharacterized protein LOC128470574 n=1 Tax=Spea bombifrons TaxID=233779 RepID=UPI002349389D|nr:uncharacterized protein LOC128470574 [Spea bombifrons]